MSAEKRIAAFLALAAEEIRSLGLAWTAVGANIAGKRRTG
jgi:hypothetical protein